MDNLRKQILLEKLAEKKTENTKQVEKAIEVASDKIKADKKEGGFRLKTRKDSAGNTRVVGEGGEVPQGVGFRKKFYKALGTKGEATPVNDPVERDVKIITDKSKLKKHTFTKKELDSLTRKQGYEEYLKRKGITPAPGHKFYPKRYGLKHKPTGPDAKALQSRPERWEGKLSKLQASQLRGKSPMYADQYAKSSGTLHGTKRMKPVWSAGRQMADEFTMSLERPSVLKQRLQRVAKR
jgi:hypothetical protein